VLGYRRALRRVKAKNREADAQLNQKVDELEAATRALAAERRAIRDDLRFLAETWDQQLADLQNRITDFARKYFEGLRTRSTLAAVERDDSTRLH
jgi:ABC-type transporter Mla subunit MlaD